MASEPGIPSQSVGAAPDVSIVIPAYNEEKFLRPCLESMAALALDGKRIEIIVADNASVDETVKVATSLGARVIDVPSGNIAAVRNRGAEGARGRVLGFVDADCTVGRAWVCAALIHFRSSDVVAVGAYPRIPDAGATWVQRTWSQLVRPPSSAPHRVSWLASANLFVRADAFREVGGFDESLVTAEDADLCYRMGPLGQVVYDDDIEAIHYREPADLCAFFKKEVWHGRGSYDGLRKGRLTLAEAPSLVAPIVTLLGWVLLVAGLVLGMPGGGWALAGVGASMSLAMPALYTARAVLRHRGRIGAAQAFALYLVYFPARAVSLMRWLLGR